MKRLFLFPRFFSLWLILCLGLPNPAYALRARGADSPPVQAGLEDALHGQAAPVPQIAAGAEEEVQWAQGLDRLPFFQKIRDAVYYELLGVPDNASLGHVVSPVSLSVNLAGTADAEPVEVQTTFKVVVDKNGRWEALALWPAKVKSASSNLSKLSRDDEGNLILAHRLLRGPMPEALEKLLPNGKRSETIPVVYDGSKSMDLTRAEIKTGWAAATIKGNPGKTGFVVTDPQANAALSQYGQIPSDQTVIAIAHRNPQQDQPDEESVRDLPGLILSREVIFDEGVFRYTAAGAEEQLGRREAIEKLWELVRND